MWGDALPSDHGATLEHYVWLIRRGLEPGGHKTDSFILTGDGGYLLSTARVELDLAELRRAADLAEAAAPGSAERLRLRAQVLDLGDGTPYEDEDAPWAEAVRAEAREVTLAALVELAGAAVEEHPERALTLARRAIALDGFGEQPYEIAMRAAVGLGRLDDALRWYERCRKVLDEELGIPPSAPLNRLRQELLSRRRAQPARGPSAPRVEARLDPKPNPPVRPAFLGRQAEVDLIITPGSTSMLHLVGPPGAGKTALLAELTRRAPGRVGIGSAAGSMGGALRLSWLRAAAQQVGVEEPGLAVLDRAAAEQRALTRGELEELAILMDRADPLVLAVDDAQHLDRDSVAELAWLRRRCPRLAVVLAYRYPRGVADRPAGTLAADLVLRLAPLTVDEVGPDAYERSGGIPALVPAADRPPQLGHAVAMHVARQRTAWMPAGAWEVLRLCATLGALRVDHLTRLTGESIAEVLGHVDRLVHAHLLAEAPDGHVRHRSGLVREAVAEQVSATHAAHLRERLAAGL